MLTYIVRRLLLLVPTLLGVLAVVFFTMAYAPGGFGGTELTEDGARSEGDDARRAQQAMQRRYGLDLPRPAQFGRWLNQVSPVGFRMSSDVGFDGAERDAVAAALADLPFNTRPTQLERAVDLAETLAGYADLPPEEAAAALRAALGDPNGAASWSLFDVMDAELSETAADNLRRRIAENLGREDGGLRRAQAVYLRELAFEASGRSRVRFDRPALKAPDLGTSLRGRDVGELLLERAPVTVLLNLLSLPLIYAVAIASGIYAARRRGATFDVGSGGVFLGLWSVPVIWAGALMITYLANEQYLRWFPTAGLHDPRADRMALLPSFGDGGFERGWLLDLAWHLVLPVACLTYGGFAVMSKVMRGSMLEALSADYVRTARAKGLAERVVLWRHAFRNSLLPMITIVSSVLPAMFAGAVVVESIFSINGMGRLGVEAAFQKDREVIMAVTLIGGVIGLSSELIRDLCYAIADPRVAYD
ncbi:MAG: ABC transporter permease [Planctomycetota bacterium]